MNKKLLSVIIFALVSVLLLGGCGAQKEPTTTAKQSVTATEPTTQSAEDVLKNFINPDHGSAVTLEGKIVLVSIFAGDKETSWNPAAEADHALIEQTRENLGIATAYLTGQAKQYGKELSFVYDWKSDKELRYDTVFEAKLVRMDGMTYSLQNEWLLNNIDTKHLLEKYKADGIIFFFFLNTDYSNIYSPWSLGHANGDYILLEFSNFYLKYNDMDVPPSTYAHEMLHAFGAHDMYYANDYFPQEFVDDMKQSQSNDIMFTVSDGKEITNELSALDAYYVGIGPRPAVAEKWHLAKSEHE